MDGRKEEEHMNAIPELTAKQNEALATLVDLFTEERARCTNCFPGRGSSSRPAKRARLSGCCSAHANADFEHTSDQISPVLKDMAFEIEGVMREKS